MSSKVKEFITNHWVSWIIEIVILSTIAFFAIAETRKTAEQTRQMLAKYDAAITRYATEKSQAVDQSVKSGVDSAKGKIEELKPEDVKNFINSFKDGNKD